MSDLGALSPAMFPCVILVWRTSKQRRNKSSCPLYVWRRTLGALQMKKRLSIGNGTVLSVIMAMQPALLAVLLEYGF